MHLIKKLFFSSRERSIPPLTMTSHTSNYNELVTVGNVFLKVFTRRTQIVMNYMSYTNTSWWIWRQWDSFSYMITDTLLLMQLRICILHSCSCLSRNPASGCPIKALGQHFSQCIYSMKLLWYEPFPLASGCNVESCSSMIVWSLVMESNSTSSAAFLLMGFEVGNGEVTRK